MTAYRLPELPFDYSALEPHVSARVMELHHGKHHAAYVKGANEVFEQLSEARDKQDAVRVTHLERALAFNVSGHVLHSVFWECLSPKGGGLPGADLSTQLERDFGSFDAFRHQLGAAAASCMGSGWGALVWEPLAGRLAVAQLYDHQGNGIVGATPVMVVDAWEHAYYLQYENRKAEFFEALWNVWDWPRIEGRFQALRSAR